MAERVGDSRPTAAQVAASQSVCSRHWKERLIRQPLEEYAGYATYPTAE